jgi:hypothetical protein
VAVSVTQSSRDVGDLGLVVEVLAEQLRPPGHQSQQ